MDRRQVILKVFTRKHQLSLQAEALAFLEQSLEEHAIEDEQLAYSLELIAKEYLLQDDCGTIVTRSLLERVLDNLQGKDDDADHLMDTDDVNPDRHLYFIDAFEMPRWHFSHERKTFERASGVPSIAGAATSRTMLLRDRHNIIRQVVLRNENFSPPAFAGRDRANYLQLTSTKNLLGRSGSRFMLFGLLVRSPEGRLCLEDIDGKVELDISETGPNEGLFTEGCFVLVEGEYNDEEVLVVFALGHPPSERREVARSIYGHIDFLGKGATTMAEDEKWVGRIKESSKDITFIVMSDVWLDHPNTLPGIQSMLRTCNDTGYIPKVFIFCGNFTSKGVGQGDGSAITHYQDNLDALADLLASFPAILAESHFLFVPGPLDPWTSSTLPRPPIPSSFTSRLRSKVPQVHFGTNPCRIKLFHQEIIVFRENMMARMLRNLVGVKAAVQDADLKKYLVQTILDQAHLSPVPLSIQAILWEYDHALRLYPMPTALILADKYQAYELTYEGCHVFNPGSFVGSSFAFSTYFVRTARSQASDLQLNDDDE